MADFLLELGTEEIPARMLDAASAELSRRVADLLVRERLIASATPQSFSTPRRLAVLVPGLAARQPDVTENVTGPPVKAAFKDGQPTAAAHAFAKKAGVAVEKLQRVTTPKGEYVAAQITTPGRSAADVLAAELPKEIAALAWPKNMYWRAGKPERFVRPIRWIVALLDSAIIPLEFAGIRAGNTSQGHRILHPGDVLIPSPAAYAETLRAAGVIVSPDERCFIIERDSGQVLFGDGVSGQRPPAGDKTGSNFQTGSGASGNDPSARRPMADGQLRIRHDAALLATTVNLTEFPSVVLGSFDREFLSLPEEVLVTVMRDHQKYFAVETSDDRLAPHFVAVLNTQADPGGLIRHGNERVLRARFNDARFFWQTDQKIPLTARVEMLKSVTFQKDLGSYYDKTQRVLALCDRLAELLSEGQRFSAAISGDKKNAASAAEGKPLDRAALAEAARLCKTDLTAELVKEFTELQGIVGGLYARAQGHGETVAQAIYHHYQPESMDSPVPPTLEGALLSLADKADTIAGMFALGLVPSGSKDPFALRRQANGIIKILAEKKLIISLSELFAKAYHGYLGSAAAEKFSSADESLQQVPQFFWERMQFYLRDCLGFNYDVVNAVLPAAGLTILPAVERAQAVAQVRGSEDFKAISIAFKRIKNILRQAREEQKAIADSPRLAPSQMSTDAERDLAKLVFERGPEIRQLSVERRYDQALHVIAQTRPAIDTFFDKVMVMVEDESVRSIRLGLLQALFDAFSAIADFSEIVTESK